MLIDHSKIMATCVECGSPFQAKGDWQKLCFKCWKAAQDSKPAPKKQTSNTNLQVIVDQNLSIQKELADIRRDLEAIKDIFIKQSE